MLDKSRDPSICHLSVYLIQDNLLSITGKFFYILNIVITVKTSGFIFQPRFHVAGASF